MIKIKSSLGWLRFFGYMTLGYGVLTFIEVHFVNGSFASNSTSIVGGIASIALVGLGIITLIIVGCLRNLEEHVAKLETTSASKN